MSRDDTKRCLKCCTSVNANAAQCVHLPLTPDLESNSFIVHLMPIFESTLWLFPVFVKFAGEKYITISFYSLQLLQAHPCHFLFHISSVHISNADSSPKSRRNTLLQVELDLSLASFKNNKKGSNQTKQQILQRGWVGSMWQWAGASLTLRAQVGEYPWNVTHFIWIFQWQTFRYCTVTFQFQLQFRNLT